MWMTNIHVAEVAKTGDLDLIKKCVLEHWNQMIAVPLEEFLKARFEGYVDISEEFCALCAYWKFKEFPELEIALCADYVWRKNPCSKCPLGYPRPREDGPGWACHPAVRCIGRQLNQIQSIKKAIDLKQAKLQWFEDYPRLCLQVTEQIKTAIKVIEETDFTLAKKD